MKISPIHSTRALKIEKGDENVLIASDLHLGISAELSKKGIKIPNQFPEVRKRLQKIMRTEKIDRVILLGDIKHNIPITSWQEWENMPDFFSSLSKEAALEIVPGNHDGDIEGLLPRDIVLHDVKGTTLKEGSIGLIHGHAWPSRDIVGADIIITGHNHPTIEFRDKLGGRVIEAAWVKTKLIPENLPKKLRRDKKDEVPEVMIVPAFSKLVGGGAINRKIPEKLLGPFFKANAIELDEAEIYLLDGTFLDKLKNLRKLSKSNDL